MSAIDKHSYFCNQLRSMGKEFNKLNVITKYKNGSTYVQIRNKYGICNVKPYHIINGGKEPTINSAIDKRSYYLNQIMHKNPEFYKEILELGEYTNKPNIRIRTKYGWLFANKTSILLGYAPTIVYAENKDEYIRNMAKEAHPEGYDYSELIFLGEMKQKHSIMCIKHGEFEQDLTCHITMGQNCPKCGILINTNMRTKTHAEFISQLKDRNIEAFNRLNFIDEYKNKNTTILASDEFGLLNVHPTTVLNGGYPTISCAVDKTEYIKNKIYSKRGKIYDLSKFEFIGTMDDKSIAICDKHGEFEISPYDLMRYVGCPACNNSVGEERISTYLKSNKIIFNPQHRFNDCRNINPLPFDFYIPDYNVCIEFQGIQHYEVVNKFGGLKGFEERKINDEIKRDYCRCNEIHLLEIKYDEINNIDNILNNLFI